MSFSRMLTQLIFLVPISLFFAFRSEAFTCVQSSEHGNAGVDGTVTWAPILKSPSDPTIDPDFVDNWLGNGTVFDVSKVEISDDIPYLIGRLYWRMEPLVDRDVTSPEKDWDCDYDAYESEGVPVPKSVHGAIAHVIKGILVDPYSVRSVGIGSTMRSVSTPGAARIACVWLNAKNSLGGYTGVKPVAVFFDADREFAWLNDSLGNSMCLNQKAIAPLEELGPND